MQLNKFFYNSTWYSKESAQIKRELDEWKNSNKEKIQVLSTIAMCHQNQIGVAFCGLWNHVKAGSFLLIPVANKRGYFCYVSDLNDLSHIEQSILSGNGTFLYDETFYSDNKEWFEEKCNFFNVCIKSNESYEEIVKEIETRKYDLYKRLPRDKKLINDYKKSVKQKCMICGATSTFKTNQGNEYFEVHHVVPYDTITLDVFPRVNLDCLGNLSLLCPNCHRKIHLSSAEIRKECIRKLLVSSNRDIQFWNDLLRTKLDNKQLEDIINEVYRKIFKFSE